MPNNKYPDGKLNEHDQGEIDIMIGMENGRVILSFPKPMVWIGMPPDMAANIGVALIQRAREAGLTEPLAIDL